MEKLSFHFLTTFSNGYSHFTFSEIRTFEDTYLDTWAALPFCTYDHLRNLFVFSLKIGKIKNLEPS